MIAFDEVQRVFTLTTKHTSYLMMIDETNHLEHLYYGKRINEVQSIDDIRYQYQFELGSSTSLDEDHKATMMQHKPLECSSFGKGDYREPTIHIELPDGSRTIDCLYESHEIIQNLQFKKMPQVDKSETLVIHLVDIQSSIKVCLYYTPLEEFDAIVRNLSIQNNGEHPIIIDKALSMSIDMLNEDYQLLKLDGAWIRERHITKVPLTYGTIRFDSKKGVSSSDHNPFFVIANTTIQEDYGHAYGFALLYSGNFETNIEISPHDMIRVNMGINSFDFRYSLEPFSTFTTPEVLLTCSFEGLSPLSQQFHALVNHKIINQNFRFKERPILINNWEATYFDFNEKKLLAIAKKASKLGIECFCLDDGWFAKRNDDFSSLGDWYHNPRKLKKGVKGIAEKINKLGLDFGIWVEPEMVNIDSDLYRAHPEWAVMIPGRKPSLGRNQLLLDLTNPDVRTYLKNVLHELLDSAPISYVKWDMNRNFSDVFSQTLDIKHQGAFHYLYVQGLYDILDDLTTSYPHILFESCASGGNRFDLGMLYYMPQTWTSDNTDSYERLLIQEGTSLLYPLSTISNHVSGERSHQVLRHTPLETRFHVACFGVLGYELDLTELTPFEFKTIQAQIAFYKTHRQLFQYGTLYRLDSVYQSNRSIWMVLNDAKDEALLGLFQDKNQPNPSHHQIRVPALKEGTYTITNRSQNINIRTFGSLVNEALPITLKVNHFLHNLIANRYLFASETMTKVLTSDQLQNVSLILPHRFTGTGHGDKDMILPDYGSRIYHISLQKTEDVVR